MVLSYQQIREMLERALADKLGAEKYWWVVDLYPDQCVYESDEHYYQCSYAITDNKITLGTPVEVTRQVSYMPLQAACQIMAAAEGDDTGTKWRTCVVKFGQDVNGVYWDQAALTAAVDLFNGAKVFALNDSQHQEKTKRFGKSPRELVGALTAASVEADGIYATLVIMPSAAWLSNDLTACTANGIDFVYGLSVDVSCTKVQKVVAGKKMVAPGVIKAVQVDVVHTPAAGGGFLEKLAAAVEAGQKGDTDMLKKLLAALVAVSPDLAGQINAGLQAGTMTEDQAVERIAAAIGQPAAVTQVQAAAAGSQDLDEMRVLACEMILTTSLAASKLPEPVQEKLRASYNGTVFTKDQLQAAIKAEKETLDKLTASGVVTGAGDARVTTDQSEKHGKMLDDFFANNGVTSFKACYQDITGDMRLSGDLRDASRLSASVDSTTFALILGDALTRRMQAEYNASGLDDWRKIVDVVPLNDFRTQHRPRMGGYGDLPTVAQGAAYGALATPDDEEATYAAAKKGGTEDITLEAIRNDDAGLIRRVPVKLARSGSRTLYKFVFGFLSSNAAIYDTKALFHVDHANLGAAALAKATLQAGRLAMMKQTEAGSVEPLGIAPRFLIVPSDLEDAAYELTAQPNIGGFTPTAPDSVRRQTWDIIAVKTWTDANNWYLGADPKDIPCIELGFLDGKEDPELFVQDMPNVGSMFSNDKLTYKIRHIYGGAVVDYRGLYGAVVV
jgi:hypothetical protein